MNQEQRQAHMRMLSSLTVRTHYKMGEEGQIPWNKGISGKSASERGRKGREAAGLVVPSFKTLKQRGVAR